MNSRTRTIKTMISVYCDAWLIVGSSVSKSRDLSRIDSGLKFDYFLLHTPMYGNYYQVKCTSTYFQFSFRFDFWLTFFLPITMMSQKTTVYYFWCHLFVTTASYFCCCWWCVVQALSSSSPSSSSTTRSTHSRLHDPKELSSQILSNLRSVRSTSTSSSSDGQDEGRLQQLDLETDFYDPTTHLYSEGVWHNCLVGIASLENNKDVVEHAYQISQSLFQYHWDGTSFQRRVWCGQWDHSKLLKSNDDDNNSIIDIEQPNYYRESSEHRCIQHGMALVFWSKLLLLVSSLPNNVVSLLQQQQRQIAESFDREFWDDTSCIWTTIGQSQEGGGGTLARPSASSGKATMLDDTNKKSQRYYRAVDQAIALLACLECIQIYDSNSNDGNNENNNNKELWIRRARQTCRTLFSEFGYQDIRTAQTYVGLNRNRNFWHESWVLLSLIRAERILQQQQEEEKGSSITDNGSRPSHDGLVALWQGLLERYGHKDDDDGWDGTVWHWSTDQKDEASNVRYCGDNALAHAIVRNLGISISSTQRQNYWNFVDLLMDNDSCSSVSTSKEGCCLASVADVYPQVRLHPNTELAALLVWPP